MRSLGRGFGWLWSAFAISTLGTWLAFSAFPLIAILALHAGSAEVAALSSAGLIVSAALAVPLGPWMEYRRKRPVMITMDLARCLALATIPVAYLLHRLTFVHLLAVAIVMGVADISFRAASGAHLKSLVRPEDLLDANGRFESTTWTASVLGPPLGGAAIGWFGPVVTVLIDAVSYLLSALGVRAIGRDEAPPPERTSPAARMRPGDLLDGWRFILADPPLRGLFLNNLLVGGLIMATEPLLAVLMLGRMGFPPWEYGLAFAGPCVGGLVGSRLSRRIVARWGQSRVLRVMGVLRSVWPIGLFLIGPGIGGLALVMAVELGLIFCMGVYNPVLATYRLERLPSDRIARALSAWAVSSKAGIALLTALWGVLGTVAGPRIGLLTAGVLLLATPALLPRHFPAATPQVTPRTAARPSAGR